MIANRSRFDPTYPHAFAVYCSDGRFTDPVEELLRSLGHPRLDTLTLPGGPGLFDSWTAGMYEPTVVEGATTFLIESHKIRHVILIAHEGCGYYRRRYGQTMTDAEIIERQLVDLTHAAKKICEATPSVEVQRYFASVVNGVVHFDLQA